VVEHQVEGLMVGSSSLPPDREQAHQKPEKQGNGIEKTRGEKRLE
jgi:hypothetical protein